VVKILKDNTDGENLSGKTHISRLLLDEVDIPKNVCLYQPCDMRREDCIWWRFQRPTNNKQMPLDDKTSNDLLKYELSVQSVNFFGRIIYFFWIIFLSPNFIEKKKILN
jgi:hypothetical protein